MELTIIIDYLIISIVASMAINSVLRNFATHKNLLVDLPDRVRRFHKRPTPLTGGLGIMLALLLSGQLYIDLNNLNGYVPEFTQKLMVSSIPLVFIFLIDDIRGLLPFQRIIIQAILGAYMIYTTNIYIDSIGNLFGFGVIELGIFSIPFTIFCIVGIMNAFNMIDGINGLCSGCAMISLLLMGFYSGLIFDSMLVLIIGAMIGFMLFNLRIFGEKRGVFLGDHGSNLIGFWVAWIAIYCSQGEVYNIEPITMIWFVAIPVLDCVSLIISRSTKGLSWSSPGRDHIHHKLMNRFSQERTLLIILITTLLTGLFGIFLENNFTPHLSTIIFILYGLIFYLFFHINKVHKKHV
jgi:UDP-GlcNAc:undecaprenyl-phosphate/decaprenyl-phosphate GlcNAc-1-phosphate transferase